MNLSFLLVACLGEGVRGVLRNIGTRPVSPGRWRNYGEGSPEAMLRKQVRKLRVGNGDLKKVI